MMLTGRYWFANHIYLETFDRAWIFLSDAIIFLEPQSVAAKVKLCRILKIRKRRRIVRMHHVEETDDDDVAD